MAIPILSEILKIINGPVNTVIDRLVPDKNKAAEMKHELEKELMRIPAEQALAFERRVTAEYEHPNWLRDSVRPVVTYCAFGLYFTIKVITVWVLTSIYIPALQATAKAADLASIAQVKGLLSEYIASVFTMYDFYLLLTIFGFWFGSKLLERVIDKIGKTGGLASIFLGLKQGVTNIYKDDV